jgi:hypothetical protein
VALDFVALKAEIQGLLGDRPGLAESAPDETDVGAAIR